MQSSPSLDVAKSERSQLLKQARAEWDRVGKITYATCQKLRKAGVSYLTVENIWMGETA